MIHLDKNQELEIPETTHGYSEDIRLLPGARWHGACCAEGRMFWLNLDRGPYIAGHEQSTRSVLVGVLRER